MAACVAPAWVLNAAACEGSLRRLFERVPTEAVSPPPDRMHATFSTNCRRMLRRHPICTTLTGTLLILVAAKRQGYPATNSAMPHTAALMSRRVMCRVVLIASLIIPVGRALAQPTDTGSTTLPRAAIINGSIEFITLPQREKLGLFGARYLVSLSRSFAFGPALFGAFTGKRGGLFVLAAELQGQRRLHGPVDGVATIAVGGGGGAAAPVGDGLFVRPTVGVLVHAGRIRSSLLLSRVYLGAQIGSTQASVEFGIPTHFHAVPRDRLDFPTTSPTRSGIGFDALDVVTTIYRPRTTKRMELTTTSSSNIGLVGVRAERALGRHFALGVAGAGAFAGGVAGYAEYLADITLHMPMISDRLDVGVRSAIGMAGGGGVPVGGGVILRETVTAKWRWFDALAVQGEAGYVAAPSGQFRALSSSLGVTWTLDAAEGQATTRRPVRSEWLLGVESYDAPRTDGRHAPLQSVAFRINRFVTPHAYLSGQARSALGGGAGAYAVGLLGGGSEWQARPRWRLGAEALVGAAGGGGVSTGSGAVVHALAYASREIGSGLDVRAGIGRVRSVRGGLNARVLDISAGYAFGLTRGSKARSK